MRLTNRPRGRSGVDRACPQACRRRTRSSEKLSPVLPGSLLRAPLTCPHFRPVQLRVLAFGSAWRLHALSALGRRDFAAGRAGLVAEFRGNLGLLLEDVPSMEIGRAHV